MSDISEAPPKINQYSKGALAAAAAWHRFGPGVSVRDKPYQAALRKFKITVNDRADFDEALLRFAREHAGIINPRVR